MGANFLNDLNSGFQNYAAYKQAAQGNPSMLNAMQKKEEQARLGEELVNNIALQHSPDRTQAQVKIPQDHLSLLQGVQGQGPEAVREMSNFLEKEGKLKDKNKDRADLQAAASSLIKKSQLSPEQALFANALIKHNPASVASYLTGIQTKAAVETGKKETAVSSLISDREKQVNKDLNMFRKGEGKDVLPEPGLIEQATNSIAQAAGINYLHPDTVARQKMQAFEQQVGELQQAKSALKVKQAGRSTFSPPAAIPGALKQSPDDKIRILRDGKQGTISRKFLKPTDKIIQ